MNKDYNSVPVERPALFNPPTKEKLRRLFQARLWREYAMAWNGKLTTTGVGRDWVEGILKISRSECLLRARMNVRIAHRMNQSFLCEK